MDTIADSLNEIVDQVDQSLPDFSMTINCTDPSCLFPDDLPLKVYDPENKTFPVIEISNQNYTVPDGIGQYY